MVAVVVLWVVPVRLTLGVPYGGAGWADFVFFFLFFFFPPSTGRATTC